MSRVIIDTGRHSRKPEHRLGTRYVDCFGVPWIYCRKVSGRKKGK